MSAETVETVKIVSPVSDGNPHGYIIINKSDMLPEHELFGGKPAKPKLDDKRQPRARDTGKFAE